MTHSEDRGHIPGDDTRPSATRSRDGSGFPSPSGMPDFSWQRWLLIISAVLGGGLLMTMLFQPQTPTELTTSEFEQRLEAGEVQKVTIIDQGASQTEHVEGELSGGDRFTSSVSQARLADLQAIFDEQNVEVEERDGSGQGIWGIILSLAPFILIVGLFFLLARRARGQMSQLTGIGQSKAKMITRERPDTTFDDVAGYEGVKEEVREVVDYLKEPGKYEKVGARGPGGILMIGPPGTGKTLLARAVAGEADVPFISVEGSSFVEMLVGVGASRVRDLFEKARKHSPAIIFIDELDSVGRKRGGSATIGANNEQEQTLNQLLAEMDGFDPSEGVVVMAATNRPNMLDEALLRPGRFDRQLEVALPQRDDRRAILRVHGASKPLADDVDLDRVARATPGFSGADLENLVNEAAITAAREDREVVYQEDFESARERIMLGRRQESTVLLPAEQERIAVHESGHAIVAALCENADPVAKVTILPARRALGRTEQLPEHERRLHSESWLHDTLAIRLGGRAAELIVLDEASTGAANDLKGATGIAERMVRDFGLSEKVGPVGYAQDAQLRPGGDGRNVPDPLKGRPYAEETQRLIDEEVARIMREAEQRALNLLEDRRDDLDDLVERLLDEETVDGAVVYEILDLPVPETEQRRDGEEIAPT